MCHHALCILQDLLERYGMTEIGMALSNPYRGVREAGTVGQPLPGVSVRIEPVSQHADLATSQSQTSGDSFASREHWYSDDSSSDEEDDRFHSSSSSKSFRVDAEQRETHAVVGEAAGELRIKGESVFKEYWNRPDATAAAFDTDGYFCTGAYSSCDWLSSCTLISLHTVDLTMVSTRDNPGEQALCAPLVDSCFMEVLHVQSCSEVPFME